MRQFNTWPGSEPFQGNEYKLKYFVFSSVSCCHTDDTSSWQQWTYQSPIKTVFLLSMCRVTLVHSWKYILTYNRLQSNFRLSVVYNWLIFMFAFTKCQQASEIEFRRNEVTFQNKKGTAIKYCIHIQFPVYKYCDKLCCNTNFTIFLYVN